MAKKTDKGWKVDFRPEGAHGRRVQRTFPTKAEATRFEAHVRNAVTQGEWNPKPADNRRLSELCDIWFKQHGQNLKDGERRHRKLIQFCERMCNPVARLLTAEKYLNYRSKRDVTPKTLNNELGYVNAVYNEMRRTDQIDYSNPLANVRPIKIAENELTYLEPDQIQELLDSIDSGCDTPHVSIIARVCLATGARWGEAEGLTLPKLKNQAATFTDTKSGKNQTVPIDDPELYAEMVAHLSEHKAMPSSITSFRRALARCSFTLPKAQASHVLRHTFASHVIMTTADLLGLKRTLGHSSITMTERYAHLAPNHMAQVVAANPLSKLKKSG